MKIEINPKFQIGDIVYLKVRSLENTRVFITEIRTITCVSGTQIEYVGRVFCEYKESNMIHSTKETLFREIELDCVIEEQKEMYEKRKSATE